MGDLRVTKLLKNIASAVMAIIGWFVFFKMPCDVLTLFHFCESFVVAMWSSGWTILLVDDIYDQYQKSHAK